MIICITPNPAIDRTLILPRLIPGEVHRAEKVIVAAGGKGVNVARVIHTLGGEPLCMGFLGGHTGRLLADLAQTEGLNSSWTWVNSETRTCMILVAPDVDATLINEKGGSIHSSDWKRLRSDVRKSVSSASLVCISGSLPPQSGEEDFHGLLDTLVKADKQLWVDTSGTALKVALAHPGICVKVNGNEIAEALGFEVNDFEAAKRALAVLSAKGLKASIITLGAAGAFLATRDGRWHAHGPQIQIASTVGSGDAFLGGFVSALDAGKGWPEALREAVAAGTANALSAGGGQFKIQEFSDLCDQVQVHAW
jgi:1-phosphofructokinase family hexose kinase